MESIHRPIGIKIMSRPQAAETLGMSVKTLSNWGGLGMGPRFVHVAGRAIHKVADVQAYSDASLEQVA